jgi:hypothetical protein
MPWLKAASSISSNPLQSVDSLPNPFLLEIKTVVALSCVQYLSEYAMLKISYRDILIQPNLHYSLTVIYFTSQHMHKRYSIILCRTMRYSDRVSLLLSIDIFGLWRLCFGHVLTWDWSDNGDALVYDAKILTESWDVAIVACESSHSDDQRIVLHCRGKCVSIISRMETVMFGLKSLYSGRDIIWSGILYLDKWCN